MERSGRSFAKTASWRMSATLTTFAIVYIATGNFIESTILAIALNGTKTLLYYIHERLWARVRWGYIESMVVSPDIGHNRNRE